MVTDRRLQRLDPETAAARARQLRFLLTDCDGVLTDGTVYYSSAGEDLLRFSRRDGMGVERLKNAGVEVAIVTRERSPIVARRAEKLGIQVFSGIRDKAAWVNTFLIEAGRRTDELAYIGDDVNDLGLIEAIAPEGLTGAPADAEASVLAAVHFVSTRPGGLGAFREFADFLLGLRQGSGSSTKE